MPEIPTELTVQAKLYAMQCLVAALAVHVIGSEEKPDDAARAIMDDALGSIAKFDLRGEVDGATKQTLRHIMEALATDTMSAAAHSVRLRRKA